MGGEDKEANRAEGLIINVRQETTGCPRAAQSSVWSWETVSSSPSAIWQISTLICSMYKGEGEGGGGVSPFKSFGGMFSLVKFYKP